MISCLKRNMLSWNQSEITSMRCFKSNNRSLSPTRQNIGSILTDTQNLYTEIRQAYNNGGNVGDLSGSCANLLLELRERMITQSGQAPNVFRNRFSDIQNQFDSLINPISHSIKNNQVSRGSSQER